MKKEVTPVPKDKCPLVVLAEMGQQTRNAWIFIHENVYWNLVRRAGNVSYTKEKNDGPELIKVKATKDYPEAEILCQKPNTDGWTKIMLINAENIAFTFAVKDPEDLFFLKMDE